MTQPTGLALIVCFGRSLEAAQHQPANEDLWDAAGRLRSCVEADPEAVAVLDGWHISTALDLDRIHPQLHKRLSA